MTSSLSLSLSIEEWSQSHHRWEELAEVIAAENQTHWAFAPYFERFSRYFLVALNNNEIVGFLMFVVWEIGPHDRDHPVLKIDDQVLTEAKIIAFGVPDKYRRRGIGRALQEQTLLRAKQLGCYQVRSVSDHVHPENHQLKLAMGFAVVPMERDEPTLTFVKQLI